MLTNALRKRELNNDPNHIRKRGLNNDRVMLTSAAWHWLRIQFRKVLTLLLWEMKRTIKTLITFFFFFYKKFL